MSAVPRWSHRDPVESGNPFPAGDPRHRRWEEATGRARAELLRYDDEIAASAAVIQDPTVYARRWMDLATMRFDTWARRGLAVVDGTAAQREYAEWIRTYALNWRTYVAETCPHVAEKIRGELALRLQTHARRWVAEASELRNDL